MMLVLVVGMVEFVVVGVGEAELEFSELVILVVVMVLLDVGEAGLEIERVVGLRLMLAGKVMVLFVPCSVGDS